VEEVDPPEPEDQQQAAAGEAQERGGHALGESGLDGGRRGQDHLTEHDQREQAVPLGNVLGMPAGHRSGSLRPDRHRDVEQGERKERDQAGGVGKREPEQPERLHDRDADGVSDCDGLAGRVVAGRP